MTKALWHLSDHSSAIAEAHLESSPQEDYLLIQSHFSLISTGTEYLVASGKVPTDLYQSMRVPYMEGDFSFPVKYGYSLVGEVISPGPYQHQMVHLLHPHQNQCLAKAEEVKTQGGGKTADVVIQELFALKEKLVTTTGDNYVAAQEPQLRGDISTLYSKIANSFQAPTASELENMKLLEDRLKEAAEKLKSIKQKRVQKMAKYMNGKGIEAIDLMPYEEFINE